MALLSPDVSQMIGHYGYGAVALAVGIESIGIGIPFPGETTLIAAAVYAGSTHQLSVTLVVVAAAAGAIMGDNIGFWIGREFGFLRAALLASRFRLTARRRSACRRRPVCARFIVWLSPFPCWPALSSAHSRRPKPVVATMEALP